MGTSSRREGITLAAALGLHALLLAFAPRGSLAALAEVRAPRAPENVIELDTESRTPKLPVAPEEPAREVPSTEAPEKPARAGGAKGAPAEAPSKVVNEAPSKPVNEAPPATPPPPSAPSAPSEPVAAAPPAGAAPAAPPGGGNGPRFSEPAPPAPGGGVVGLPPGLGGAPIWSVPGVMSAPTAAPAAPTAAPAPRPVDANVATKVVAGSLHKRDQELGLDAPAGGVVASVIADAVRGAPIPADARATFEVRLDADGNVAGVRLVTASAGDQQMWDRVVRSAKGSLGGRSLKVGGQERAGATVTVKIESNVQFPGGSKQRVTAEPVCANDALAAIEAALKDPRSIGADLPAPGTAGTHGAALGAAGLPPPEWDEQRKKFCIPVGIRGRVDLANIGAHAVNVVKSTFTVKRDGERALPAGDVLPIDTRVPWARPDPTLQKAPPPPKKKKKKWER
jgi:hypothetical protein